MTIALVKRIHAFDAARPNAWHAGSEAYARYIAAAHPCESRGELYNESPMTMVHLERHERMPACTPSVAAERCAS